MRRRAGMRWAQAPDDDSGKPEPSAQVNIKDFANRVVDGDWSPAI